LVRETIAVVRESLKVGIVSGNRLLRESVETLIRQHVESAYCLSIWNVASSALGLDVLLIDADDVENGELSELVAKLPKAKIIIMNSNPKLLNIAECIRLGAAGFLLKDASATDLITAVQKVSYGDRAIPPEVTAHLYEQLYAQSSNPAAIPNPPSITVRERQICRLVVKGLTNKEIANELNIAESTVKNHIHRILQKRACRSRTDLIRSYMRSSSEAE